MDTNELKFLIKVFDCHNHRIYLANPAFDSFKDKDLICEKLGNEGLVDFSKEIIAMTISPAGRDLLKKAKNQNSGLPINELGLRVLEKIDQTPKIKPSEVAIYIKGKKILAGERDDVIDTLYSEGFIFAETSCKKEKAEVWLTDKGVKCLEKLDDYFQQLRKNINIEPESIAQSRQPDTQIKLDIESSLVLATAAVSRTNDTINTQLLDHQISDEEILATIRTLDKQLQTDNYLPIFYLREKLQPPLSTKELDQALYNLQKRDLIELSAIQEGLRYSTEQLKAAISQEDVDRRLFFIIVN